MNLPRVGLAALAATIVYFLLGGLLFAGSPLKREFQKYPAVYRSQETMKAVWPIGIVGMVASMIALALLYALLVPTGTPTMRGLCFGLLIAVYAVGSFVLHNHVNLNIGLRLTVGQAIAYFIQWLLVGLVIGAVYRPL